MRVPFRKDAFHSIPNFGLVGWTATKSGRIYKSDAIDLVKSIPDDSVDLVVTDTAYESLEKWRKLGTTTRLKKSKGSSNKWFKTFPNSGYIELFAQFYRVLKGGTHLYMFCDEETRDIMLCGWSAQSPEMGLLRYKGMSGGKAHVGMSPLLGPGFKFWKSIIWDKEVAGMGYHYRAQHELILMAEKVKSKGKHRRLNDAGPGDVLSFKRLKGKKHKEVCTCERKEKEPQTQKGTSKRAAEGGLGSSTISSGKRYSDQSQVGTTSTIRTRSKQTTGLRISNSSPKQITKGSIQDVNLGMVCGGSPAKIARNSNPSTKITGTSPQTGGGLSMGDAARVTSNMSSSTNRCERCGLPFEPYDIFPTEKPFDLVKMLITQSTNPGDTVLDPFCGSGVVGQVCEQEGRNYILGDVDPAEAIKRLTC